MKKIKKRFKKVLIGLLAFAVAMILNVVFHMEDNAALNNIRLVMFLVVYLIAGEDVIRTAAKNIMHGRMMDEQFLMTLATVCAFLVGEYPEGAAVMLFYQVGELFQSYAVYNSRKSISELMDIRPDYANVMVDGVLQQVAPESVAVDSIIVVKPGEKVPLDGVVEEGSSTLDTKALTGESLPRDIKASEAVLSGCINVTGNLSIRVTKPFGESTVAKILDLVENQGSKKAKKENFITRFAKVYTPIVVAAAVVLAIVPTLIMGLDSWSVWVYRAMCFLVVSCPCALVISVPLSFFGGLGGASRKGLLVKGSNYLESVSEIDTIVFDKTGTLTRGTFNVTQIMPAGDKNEADVLKYAAGAEKFSNHPIAKSLVNAYASRNSMTEDEALKQLDTADVEEIAGHGIHAVVEGHSVLAGNVKLMQRSRIACEPIDAIGTIVYVAVDDAFAGSIVIADEVKADAKEAIARLKRCGVEKLVMLTGDNQKIANRVAEELGIAEVCAELLPQDKVAKLEEIMAKSKTGTAFVGDGVNDAPVLARADVGIAMGGMGSDAAIEAADIVIMTDEPSRIATVIRIAKKTIRIANENIVFALGIKIVVLILAAVGIASMWLAVFADVGVAVLAILNSTRAMRTKGLE